MNGSLPALGRLLPRLIAGGLLQPDDVHSGAVQLADVSRSNPVFLVTVGGQPRMVAKLAGVCLDGIEPIAAEAAAYRWLAGNHEPTGPDSRAGTQCLGSLTLGPRLLGVDNGLLVVEAVTPAQSLAEVALGDVRRLVDGFGALGVALATLHARTPGEGVVVRRPWALDLGRRLPAALGTSPLVERALHRLRSIEPLMDVLSCLGASWTASAVIHGDAKTDNALLTGPGGLDGLARIASPDSPDSPDRRITLIDWELCGLGEPGWDLATAMESLAFTARRCGLPSPAGVRRALAALADGYRAHRPLPPPHRLAQHLAARAAQTCIQLAAMASNDPAIDEPEERCFQLVADLATLAGDASRLGEGTFDRVLELLV